jgi:methylthioribose-1-phosphate isomerase
MTCRSTWPCPTPPSTGPWRTGCATYRLKQRSADEVTHLTGRAEDGAIVKVQVSAPGSGAGNPAFDVTPARLVTGLITERGVTDASEAGLLSLYPEKADG